MPRKPRVAGRSQEQRRVEIAERLRDLARLTSGPDATFEDQQDAAAAAIAAVLAELSKDDQERVRGTGSCREAG
jgi:hypothetical protein